MKKLVILSLLTISLFALNPKVYTSLGDTIYNNVNKIDNLQNIPEYAPYEKAIQKYVLEVFISKKNGFTIENGDENISASSYLQKLRSLNKQQDTLLRSVKNNFDISIKNENNELFTALVNSGLIDIKEYKHTIMKYYFNHIELINPEGVIQTFLDNNAKLRAQAKRRKLAWIKHQKALEVKKIKRLRKADKEKQEKIENQLEMELKAKKKKIFQEQHRELLR